MHEMGIAQQLVNIALDAIPDDITSPKVETLNLKIGRLASVVEHSLTFCLEIITKDTPLENARVVIENVPVTVICHTCNNQWQVDGPVFACSKCEGGGDIKMLTGREIEITSLELAD